MIRMTKSELIRALSHEPINLGGQAFPFIFRLLSWVWFALVVCVVVAVFGSKSHQGGDANGTLVVSVFAVSGVVLAYLSMFLINRLTLDLPTHTYIREHGLYPFIKRWQGSLGEFDHLELDRQRFEISGERGQTNEYFAWLLRLAPKETAQSADELPAIVVFGWGGIASVNRAEMLPLAERLAQKTGLPLSAE